MHVFCLRCLLKCGSRSSPRWPHLLYGLKGCNKGVVLLSSRVGHSPHLVLKLITHGALLPAHHTSWRGVNRQRRICFHSKVRDGSTCQLWQGVRPSVLCEVSRCDDVRRMAARVGIFLTFELDGGERHSWPTSRCIVGEGLTLLSDKVAAWAPEPVWAVWKEKRIFATS